MRYPLTILALTAVALFPALAIAQEAAETASVWDWTPILQAVGATVATVLSALLVMLFRAGLRYLDTKTGWHTEQRYAAVAQRRVLAIEQTARKQIQADLEDGKITAEEAKALVKKLGQEAAKGLMEELGLSSQEQAEELIEAAVVATGAATRGKAKEAPAESPTPAPSAP